MISISVAHYEENCSIVMEGHAGYAEPGKDIICAAVSALYISLINGIDGLSSAVGNEYLHGDSHLYCISGLDRTADILIDSFRQSCRSIAEENREYVRYRDV